MGTRSFDFWVKDEELEDVEPSKNKVFELKRVVTFLKEIPGRG